MKTILIVLIAIIGISSTIKNFSTKLNSIPNSNLIASSSDDEYDDEEGSEEEQENEEIEENA